MGPDVSKAVVVVPQTHVKLIVRGKKDGLPEWVFPWRLRWYQREEYTTVIGVAQYQGLDTREVLWRWEVPQARVVESLKV